MNDNEIMVLVFVRGSFMRVFGVAADYIWVDANSALLYTPISMYQSVRFSLLNTNFLQLSEIQLIKTKPNLKSRYSPK